MTFQIVIFAGCPVQFEMRQQQIRRDTGFKNEIFFCDSNQISRLDFLRKNAGWFLFLDSDCEVAPLLLETINVASLEKNIILAGGYVNPKNATYLQRAHNFIANTWLNSAKLFLGGGFFIHSSVEQMNVISDAEKIFWGAEDKKLAGQLLQAGYSIQKKDDLKLTHHTSKKLKHFIRRAWLQGYNDNSIDRKEKTNLSYWLSELVPTNFDLAPAVLLHFLVLWSGKLFQKIRLQRN